MSAAVDRLVAQAVEQGFGEFVSDEIAERCGAILRRTRTDRVDGSILTPKVNGTPVGPWLTIPTALLGSTVHGLAVVPRRVHRPSRWGASPVHPRGDGHRPDVGPVGLVVLASVRRRALTGMPAWSSGDL